MGNGMNKILPGLYVGNFYDSKDKPQLKDNGITHILAIHDNAKKLHEDIEYLCITASDNSRQDLTQFFSETNTFIHRARISGGNVLVHCLAGVSRSVTVTVAYVMCVTNLTMREALHATRGARRAANPNFGFQQQLLEFELSPLLKEEQTRLRDDFQPFPHDDNATIQANLAEHQRWVLQGDPSPATQTYPLAPGAYKPRDATVHKGGTSWVVVPEDAGTGKKERRKAKLVAKSGSLGGEDQQNDVGVAEPKNEGVVGLGETSKGKAAKEDETKGTEGLGDMGGASEGRHSEEVASVDSSNVRTDAQKLDDEGSKISVSSDSDAAHVDYLFEASITKKE